MPTIVEAITSARSPQTYGSEAPSFVTAIFAPFRDAWPAGSGPLAILRRVVSDVALQSHAGTGRNAAAA